MFISTKLSDPGSLQLVTIQYHNMLINNKLIVGSLLSAADGRVRTHSSRFFIVVVVVLVRQLLPDFGKGCLHGIPY
jgi:hypothetical protein